MIEGLTLYAFSCGWFNAPLGFFVEGADDTVLRSPIPAYLIDHPKGRALFDTGLSHRFRQPIGHCLRPDEPGWEFDESADIAARLRMTGVDPGSIRWIVNSHFHNDHCGGNASIPNATIIVQSRERAAAQRAVDAGSQLYDKADFDCGHPVIAIEGEHDLFGDGSVTIFPTYGHTAGHQSVCVRLAGGNVVLAADCCYLQQNLDGLRASPGDSDREAALDSLRHLSAMRAAGARIFFGHDGTFWRGVKEGQAIR